MTSTDAILLLRDLQRPSRSGYELTVCIVSHSVANWSYCLIRYPEKLTDDWDDCQLICNYAGCTWPEIAADVWDYLADHPKDGFYYYI